MDPKAIKANFDARQNAVAELRTLADQAAGREFTAEEREKEERINTAVAEYDTRITEGLRQLEADKASDEARAQFDALTAASGSATETEARDVDLLAKLVKGEIRSAQFRPADTEVRDLTKGGAQGESNTIRTLYAALHENLRHVSSVIQAEANILRTETGEDIIIPKVSAYSAAAIVAEGVSIGVSEPDFAANTTLKAWKYAFIMKVSRELMQDNYVNLVEFLGRQGGVSMGHGIGTHLVSGTGTGQPQGVLNATTGETIAVAGTLTADDLIDLQHSVPVPYRSRAKWLFNDTTIKAVRKLKDSDGQYIWQPGLQAGAPDVLLGKPVLEDPAVPALDAVAGTKFGVFGDFSGYTVRFAQSLEVVRSEEFAFDTDMTAWRFVQRADGRIVDTDALRVIKNP